MEKWISISAKRHKAIEIISNSKSHHKLQLKKYIFADSFELQSDELVDQIKKLNELYKNGVLSKEEFLSHWTGLIIAIEKNEGSKKSKNNAPFFLKI